MRWYVILFLLINVLALYSCRNEVRCGAELTAEYLPMLEGRRVALLSNHTGMVGDKHTLDILLENGINVTAVFSPEHGFRGTASAGEHVSSSVDEKTGIPILSLYSGGKYQPSDEDMQKFDVLVCDIQDVGLRFYTYYVTMVRMMAVLADYGKTMIVLDRPNPNGWYVDGPVLDMKYKSGVGWLPIPVVHGMTMGEIALMTNGEGWLPEGKHCDLVVIRCRNYDHNTLYRLPIAPSPNLNNMLAVYLYPSMCYFEGTPVSLGRGTDKPFLQYGHPAYENTGELPLGGKPVTFTPRTCPQALNPPQEGNLCYGVDLSGMSEKDAVALGLDLSLLIDAYRHTECEKFFTPFFEKLIGVDYVREMIEAGCMAEEIKARWQDDVERFKKQRKPYLLYKE